MSNDSSSDKNKIVFNGKEIEFHGLEYKTPDEIDDTYKSSPLQKPFVESVKLSLPGVLKTPVPPVAPNSITLETFRLFVKFVFADILSALSVPSTITEPTK